MTISSTTRKAGPTVGNGVTTVFPFTFKCFAASDIVATLTVIATEVESVLVLNTDYTVALNADQDAAPGGSVTYNPLGVPMAATHMLTLTSNVLQLQGTVLTNGGGFFPKVIEHALDRATILIQQLAEQVSRAVLVPVSSAILPSSYITALEGFVAAADADAVAAAASNAASAASAAQSAASAAIAVATLPLRRNVIIGGDFSTNPWQRGTTFAAVANGAFGPDRWLYVKAGSLVHTMSKSASVPSIAQSARLLTNSLVLDCTTAQAVIGAADMCALVQKIEGYNFLALAQQPMTLSFWHAHTKPGTYCVALSNGVDRHYVAEYTQLVADTWERAVIDIPASPAAGTWSYTTSTGLLLYLTLACGTNHHAAPGAWFAGATKYASVAQVNGVDDALNNSLFADIRLAPGTQASEVESRSEQEELALCQRYFYKTFPQGVTPVQNVGNVLGALVGTSINPSTGLYMPIRWPVPMRATPTVVTFNPMAANAQVRDFSAALDGSGVTAGGISDEAAYIYTLTAAGSTQGFALGVHLTASAEL